MGKVVKSVFGGGDSSKAAARAQTQSSREAIAFQKEALGKIRGDLKPFREAGGSALSPLQGLVTDPNRQAQFLQNNPILNAVNEQTRRAVFANQAARGKLGSGGTLEELQSRFTANALPILDQQQGQLFNLAAMGQNAAAQQGTATQNTGNAVSSLLTGIGNARAAGIVGAQNANAQIGQTALGAGIGALAGGAGLLGSSVGAGGGALLGLLSDKRLKEDLRVVGALDSGIPVYTFRYVGEDVTRIGVMAQDVEQVMPVAVMEVDGIKYVNHAELGKWQSIH